MDAFMIDPDMPVAVILPAVDWLVIAIELSKSADHVIAACNRTRYSAPCTSCQAVADGMERMAGVIMETAASVATAVNEAS